MALARSGLAHHAALMMQPVNDGKLRSEIEEALADDFLVDESKFDVEVSDGVVTLVGTVGTYAEKAVAQATARSVDGVHDLVNAIAVKPTEAMRPSDAELTDMVQNVLAWDALVPDRDLDVTVERGVVTLSGRCLTTVQIREAERAISHLAGVQQLVNNIELSDPQMGIDDVRAVIAETLTKRALHQSARIEVVVDGGQVTLAGPTQSAMERRAILGAVGHADGVTKVRNELIVESPVD